MLLIPLSDENPTYRRPYVNYAIIALNFLVALLVFTSGDAEEILQKYGMKPAELSGNLHTLFTSMFLHAGFFHLLGNMWFLWIVGDNVEDSLGHGWYLLAYLTGGVAADLIHAATAVGRSAYIPTVGASGAVSAVMGYYLVIFPRNRIRIFYWLWWYILGTFYVRAVWAIGFWFLWQLMWAFLGAGGVTGVAYWAHVGGFAFGVGLASFLRSVWPDVDPHRRAAGAAYAGAGRGGRSPGFGGAAARPSRPGWRPFAEEVVPGRRGTYASPEEAERALEECVSSGDLEGALRALDYFLYSRRPAAPALQLHLARELIRQQRYQVAAQCLEHFLETHPRDVNAPEAMLALGMLYARHLGRPDRARLLLGAAAVQHPVPHRAALAREELAALG